MATSAPAQTPRRVACIGDSITYGDKIPDRDARSYPAVLQRLSQGRFEVGNFGVNGATALRIPFRSWSDSRACREAIDFAPDVAVVMLGINDLAYAGPAAGYSAALRDVVVRFQNLPSRPRLYLCTLTPIAPEEQQRDANRAIRDEMNPAIRAVAAETGAGLVDVSAAFPNRLELLPDGLHPSPEGAELIARTVFAALEAPAAAPPQIQPAPIDGPVDASIRNEARAAIARAERWLETHPPPADLPEPPALEETAPFLPLLAGPPSGANGYPYATFAALAAALDRAGEETVFPGDGRPVAWRKALLRQLVQRQRIDAQGGGFWSRPDGEDEDASESARSTAYALRALAIALGE
ncbi:MAG: GDSL-type esterase/lipase family protein [Kiritimatiellia bacterium]